MHINEGKDKLALFSTKYNLLLTPLPFQFYCPPQFFYALLHNFIFFPPQCFLFLSSTTFIIFPPQYFLFLSSTSTSSFLLFFLHLLLLPLIFIVFPPPHFYCFSSSSSSFLLFSLLLLLFLHHLLLIYIVFPRKGQNQTITFEFGLIGLILAFWPFQGKTI